MCISTLLLDTQANQVAGLS